jgi:hypothetical protein
MEHSVTLHLRARNVGGKFRDPKVKEFAAQCLMRALSRYYAIHSGFIKAGDNLDWIQAS